MCVESSVESSTVGRQRGRGAGGMRFSVPLGYKYSRESLERRKDGDFSLRGSGQVKIGMGQRSQYVMHKPTSLCV